MDLLRGHVSTVTARIEIPALVRGDELITETGLFGRCIQIAQELEANPKGLSAGMFIGNPFTDVPELGTLSFAVTDNDERLACEQALRMVELFWEHHEKMQVPLISLEEMQRQLLSLDGAVEEGLPKSRIGSN